MKKNIIIEDSTEEDNININLIYEEIDEAASIMYDEYSEFRDSEVIEILKNLLRYLKKWK